MHILLKEIIQRDLKYSFFFFLMFLHLAALGLSYSMWDLCLFVCSFQHVGSLVSAYGISSSQTKDQTWAPCIGSAEV